MRRRSNIALSGGKPRKNDHRFAEWGEHRPPVLPLAPSHGWRPDPAPMLLNYRANLDDAVYRLWGRMVTAVEWEVRPVVHATDVPEVAAVSLECTIVYRTLPGMDDYHRGGSLPKHMLESKRPERAFGRGTALHPPRWFAEACRNMLHEYEAHRARQKLADAQ